jgi:3-oxoacyl-[acyl-carrier protein] reductase
MPNGQPQFTTQGAASLFAHSFAQHLLRMHFPVSVHATPAIPLVGRERGVTRIWEEDRTMLIDLRGKVGIVTGAGRGIGRVIAEVLAREGVTTIVTDVRQEYLDDVAQTWATNGWQGKQYICDVRDEASITSMVSDIEQTYGQLDLLVNNAGVFRGGWVESLSEQDWDLSFDVNLKGVFLMSKAVVPIMKRQRSGRIINAASFAAVVPSIGSSSYAAAKAGVHYFTRTLAGELGPWNITVNCYAPGMIPTEMNHFAEQSGETQERLLDTLTLRRWGGKEDVANLICFLASDLAAYITGTLVDVSGGKLATQLPQVAWEKARAAGEVE